VFYKSFNTSIAINRTWLIAIAALLLPGFAARAQILQGEWVDQSEAAIEQYRKTDVTVIVIDSQDRAVQGAQVRLVQQRHDFVIGLTLPADRSAPADLSTLPVYRCINALAYDRLTDWSVGQAPSSQVIELQIAQWTDAVDPIRTSFGRVISADPVHNQDEVSLLQPADLRNVVMARLDYAMRFDNAPDEYDLYADMLYQDMVERKLGFGMIHRMFASAGARRPDAQLGLRVRDAITLRHARQFAETLQRFEAQQVPFDHVTIEQRFDGQINPNAFNRMLESTVGRQRVPVTLAGVEVGASTEVAAGLNMETLLRLLFAQPNVQGIYFSGLYQDELLEEHAALLGADGQPTAAGTVLDHLFNEHWISDETATTDERGNAQSRVFTGWYEITATLPDGTQLRTEAYIPASERTKLIVLQQTAADQPPAQE